MKTRLLKSEYRHSVQGHDGKRLTYWTNFKRAPSSRPVIMFNYGLVCSIHHFGPQVTYLDQLGFPILFHDYRGHFESEGHDDIPSLTFENMARDMKCILDQEKLSHVTMIGHSMGVNTTLEFAKRYPDILESMVLISGTIFPVTDVMFDSHITKVVFPHLHTLSRRYPEFARDFMTSKNPLFTVAIKQGGFNPQHISNEFIDRYLKGMSDLGHELFFQLFWQMAEHDIAGFLEDFRIPALVVGGDKDHVIPHYIQTILHKKLMDSELYIVKNGSHVPQIDFPQYINERIECFLSGPSSSRV